MTYQIECRMIGYPDVPCVLCNVIGTDKYIVYLKNSAYANDRTVRTVFADTEIADVMPVVMCQRQGEGAKLNVFTVQLALVK